MDKSKAKNASLARRKRRVRGKIFGTTESPRLSVTRSSKHIYAQIIDDSKGHTLCAASSIEGTFKDQDKSGANAEGAKSVGELLGERASGLGISSVVFDRGGRIYHGRIKALAEGARDKGLRF